jgi:hypothetical protein
VVSTEWERPLEIDLAASAGLNFEKNGPTSFVAAEIHLGHWGQQASATAGCSATFKLRASLRRKKYRDISNC